MRRFLVSALALAGLLAVSGCAGAPKLEAQVQSYAGSDPLTLEDRVWVVPAGEPGKETLEQRSWAALLDQEFRKRGIQTVPSAQGATAFAIISMAIDEGRDVTSTFAVPHFGVTGYSGSNTYGTVNSFGGFGTVNATTTYTPTYGITGFSQGSRTERRFRRFAQLGIFRPGKSNPLKIYESKLSSEGGCGMIGAVAPILVQAALVNYPNSGAKTVSLPFPGC